MKMFECKLPPELANNFRLKIGLFKKSIWFESWIGTLGGIHSPLQKLISDTSSK